MNLYSGGFWGFPSPFDMTNAAIYENNTKLYSYGIAVIRGTNLIVDRQSLNDTYNPTVQASDNSFGAGGVGGFSAPVMAAYLRQTE
jgi:hypothetical protein